MEDSDRLRDSQWLADFLDVPVKTVFAWRHRRVGPPGYRIGKHVRYREADVLAWLEEQADDRDDRVPA